MILDEVIDDISTDLDGQKELGIQITALNDVPEKGPANSGVWNEISQVTVVFVDMKGSTNLNNEVGANTAARAYTYFVRSMVRICERFSSNYIDVQGDGVFGLFSGRDSLFSAVACAITMRTAMESIISKRFEQDAGINRKIYAGIGMDQEKLLVRRLGLRYEKENEVWAGKPVNIASKLSSAAQSNQVCISERVHSAFTAASRLRQRALLWSCGCDSGIKGAGLDLDAGETTSLWTEEDSPEELGLDFSTIYRLTSKWCDTHGAEFCEAIVQGRKA